jgi:hypothetical protein
MTWAVIGVWTTLPTCLWYTSSLSGVPTWGLNLMSVCLKLRKNVEEEDETVRIIHNLEEARKSMFHANTSKNG